MNSEYINYACTFCHAIYTYRRWAIKHVSRNHDGEGMVKEFDTSPKAWADWHKFQSLITDSIQVVIK
jgi:hypothetical protein